MTTTDKSAVIKSVNWTEKHRPTKLEDVALSAEDRALLAKYIEDGEVPNILLVGPPGSGKTTLARILIASLDCTHLPLNASVQRGIDIIREKIGPFVTALTKRRWNIVFLDEADALTTDAQTGLRNPMENFEQRARFIMTANYQFRIIRPLQSRCQVFVLGAPPTKERGRILARILKAEKIAFDGATVMAYAERFEDMRTMIWAAQRAVFSKKATTLPPVSEAGPIDGAQLFELLEAKDYAGFIALTKSSGFDVVQGLRELFKAIPLEHAMAGPLLAKIGRGVHETGFTPDPAVLFLAVVAEAAEVL